ncbi:ROK family protein [candidate division KSB1 bacterium]
MAKEHKYFIGLDLGASSLKYALVREDGFIHTGKQRPALALNPQKEILDNLADAVSELAEVAAGDGITPLGVGVGSPGAINAVNGRVIGIAPNIPDWLGADIKGHLEAAINLTTMADNDANLMALAEARLGAGKDFPHLESVVALTLGTGIGGGIIIDGKLLHGYSQSASEIGHMILYPDGLLCDCGSRGCFEKYVAGPAMVRRVLEMTGNILPPELEALTGGDPEKLEPKLIFQAIKNGCRVCREVIDGVTHDLGIGIASVVSIINPGMIVIGGGIADAGDGFVQEIEKVVKNNALKAVTRELILRRATLGNDAGVVGAMLIICEHLDGST